jgi:hypothetical protein
MSQLRPLPERQTRGRGPSGPVEIA